MRLPGRARTAMILLSVPLGVGSLLAFVLVTVARRDPRQCLACGHGMAVHAAGRCLCEGRPGGEVPAPAVPVVHGAAGVVVGVPALAAGPGSGLWLFCQVRDSTGPLNQWPAGHRIMALSRGPPVERMVNRHVTSAGSPHLTAPSSSRQAGQSRNIMLASAITRSGAWMAARALRCWQRRAGPGCRVPRSP